MVVLIKFKASTLIETLVASVLIVLVFMLSSMIVNNLFSNTVKGGTKDLKVYLNELEYLYIQDQLIIPYNDDFKDWQITIYKHKAHKTSTILLEAINSSTNKTVKKILYENGR